MKFYGIPLTYRMMNVPQLRWSFKGGGEYQGCKVIIEKTESRDAYYLVATDSINFHKTFATEMFSSTIRKCWDSLALFNLGIMPVPSWYSVSIVPEGQHSESTTCYGNEPEFVAKSTDSWTAGGFSKIQKLLHDKYLDHVEFTYKSNGGRDGRVLNCIVEFHADVVTGLLGGINSYSGNIDNIAKEIILDLEKMLKTQLKSSENHLLWLRFPISKSYWSPDQTQEQRRIE